MKKPGRIIGTIAAVVLFILCGIFVKNKIDENKAYYANDYYVNFKSDAPLEKKYSGKGEYEVKNLTVKSGEKNVGKIRIWYPLEMEEDTQAYPLILIVNPSNTRAKNYLPYFERLASWGFIVAGNDDAGTGTGESASRMLDYLLKESEVREKIDTEKIGIAGYSQGGAGALAAVTMYGNGSLYSTVFTGSAAYPFLANNMGWKYEVSKVTVPYFMTAGTGTSDDTGVADITKEYGGVSPFAALKENYEAVSESVEKVRARASGAEHGEMLERTDGYMTAWMLYQLKGDEEAASVFVGEEAEILHNSNWQDVAKNR